MRIAVLVTGLVLTFTMASAAPGLSAQAQTYTNPKIDYVIELPSPTWHLVVEPDDIHPHAEWVYGDRLDGYLRIRKATREPDLTLSEFAHRDQDQKVRFLPGYVDGKEEPFAGQLNGVTVSYEYTYSGKAMAGRTYYLQTDSHTVYALQFTGLRDKLLHIRNQTDLIARSFRLK